jgi:dephospho-CoA kinase
VTRIVGLTGGIGTGKSTVARLFAELGARVIDADQLAREAQAKGSPVLGAIRGRFGSGVFTETGELDRKALGAIVFQDETARRDLNAIVHPRVAELAQERMQAMTAAGVPLVLYDVPLLYESSLDRALPAVIVVSAPPEVQRARLAGRDGLSPSEIEARIAAQMPLSEKVARADFVIDNGGSLEATREQVASVYRRLIEGDGT